MNSISAILLAIMLASVTTQPASTQTSTAPPFWPEIRAYLKEDQAQGIEQCRTLFIGSSSIRLWLGLSQDMPRRKVVQRGFGGAHLSNVVYYYKPLIARHRPREIVLYAGENDLSAGRTPAEVLADLNALLTLKSQSLGNTTVYFIAIKPSIARWREFALQTEANALVKKLAETRSDLVFVDVVPLMLETGRVKQIFLPDGLHMNLDGYAIWAKALNSALDSSSAISAHYCRDKTN